MIPRILYRLAVLPRCPIFWCETWPSAAFLLGVDPRRLDLGYHQVRLSGLLFPRNVHHLQHPESPYAEHWSTSWIYRNMFINRSCFSASKIMRLGLLTTTSTNPWLEGSLLWDILHRFTKRPHHEFAAFCHENLSCRQADQVGLCPVDDIHGQCHDLGQLNHLCPW